MKLPARIKRLVFSSFLFFILYSLFFIPTTAYAQTQINNQATSQQTNSTIQTNTNPDVPKNLHTWTQNVMIETMAALICQLAGIDPVNPNQECLGVDTKTNKIGFVKNGGGAIGVANNMIAMMYTAPIHTGDYVNYLAQNFGIVKPAYAQQTGTGFDGIKPLLGLWVTFRNIVYMLFVAVFAVIGFGIMLRINIDPRTVMAISNQLPKIIIAILLVTFSFAISGFLIDIMWVSMHLTYNVIADAAKKQNVNVLDLSPAKIAGKSVIEANGGNLGIAKLAGSTALGGQEAVRAMLDINPTPFFNFGDIFKITKDFPYIGINKNFTFKLTGLDTLIDFVSVVVAFFSSGTVGSMFSSLPVVGVIAPVATGPLIFGALDLGIRVILPLLVIWIIVFTALLWALFRVWFVLLKAYVSILINIIIAPFWIVAGLIPGSSISFGAWFREMLGNLSAFPVTYGMLLVCRVFFETFNNAPADQHPFTPPLLGNLGNTNFLASIIGVGVILLTPQVIEMMHELFKVPPFKYSGGINQAIGVGTGVTNVAGHASSIGNMMFGFSHTPFLNKLPFLKNFGGGAPTTQH